MRILAFVTVASLALTTPGCTVIGACIGGSVRTSKDSSHELLGAGIGLLVDIIVVATVASQLVPPWPFPEIVHAGK